MAAKEWYKDWFSSPYYEVLYYKRNEAEAAAFIERLVNHLQPSNGSLMLDVACGKGRHSRELAEMGFDVTGIDIAVPAISEALKYQADNLHFFVHDMRLPFYINYFKYAFNFFTSFGYFNTQREHDNALRTIAQSLETGGIFVIDYLNASYVTTHLIPTENATVEDAFFTIKRWQTTEHFFKEIKIVVPGTETMPVYTEKVAKFSLLQLTEMLSKQHLEVQEVFGNYQLGQYDEPTSPRLIIIAKKVK